MPGEPARACEHCGTSNDVIAPPADAIIERCAACGHDQLYFQKDFNRTTGIAIVVLGSIFVPWTYGLSLLGVTILDYIVWRLVRNVIVCYRCQAVHRGYPPNAAIKPRAGSPTMASESTLTTDALFFGEASQRASASRCAVSIAGPLFDSVSTISRSTPR